ncbi:MAG: lysophospholipid acyltransferase family protein [Gammaproteobacteria bacterium]|nr:lysophospholipid acyltransferase family protein [Gammaproteobacteria bacterium]
MLKHYLAIALMRMAALLPLGTTRWLARSIVHTLGNSNNRHRHIAQTNIALTQPSLSDQARQQLVNRALEQSLCTTLEMPLIWRRDNAWLQSKILRVDDDAILTSALATNKGVLLICPHVGNWEVLGRYLPRYANTTSLYQPPKIDWLESFVKHGREMSGAELVPTSQRGVARLLKALQRGEIVGMLPDQVPKQNAGVYAPFFGVPAYTMTLVYKLLQKTGCQAVLGYTIREDRGFRIIFKTVPGALYSEDMQESVAALNQLIETATEEDLAQYQWAYKRFKRQPNGSNPYAIA